MTMVMPVAGQFPDHVDPLSPIGVERAWSPLSSSRHDQAVSCQRRYERDPVLCCPVLGRSWEVGFLPFRQPEPASAAPWLPLFGLGALGSRRTFGVAIVTFRTRSCSVTG